MWHLGKGMHAQLRSPSHHRCLPQPPTANNRQPHLHAAVVQEQRSHEAQPGLQQRPPARHQRARQAAQPPAGGPRTAHAAARMLVVMAAAGAAAPTRRLALLFRLCVQVVRGVFASSIGQRLGLGQWRLRAQLRQRRPDGGRSGQRGRRRRQLVAAAGKRRRRRVRMCCSCATEAAGAGSWAVLPPAAAAQVPSVRFCGFRGAPSGGDVVSLTGHSKEHTNPTHGSLPIPKPCVYNMTPATIQHTSSAGTPMLRPCGARGGGMASSASQRRGQPRRHVAAVRAAATTTVIIAGITAITSCRR